MLCGRVKLVLVLSIDISSLASQDCEYVQLNDTAALQNGTTKHK